ncbi:protein VASCULAR ASSOCIATED DEATH 1, chloroplastic isoform X1 [Selaginella moellendorffii]|uniref:protein VASCULAR ASSOCIATED DEATH 1, chloroplastic isoform X1 n=1 Tax=Selaginella moellendorffii TaxID=88036 RepID=UPI000D1CA9DA|nr:protein VASCULAR ASSOCIATED DEATH 1, chloroplastic isoform X1 [Selaginella moellendorffii]|eukprot:XP_024544666.1 protein VASCULAR ASSOCIATED DEATH 1, chloroplastic isoform X1 [Selaginella moellendorffii]
MEKQPDSPVAPSSPPPGEALPDSQGEKSKSLVAPQAQSIQAVQSPQQQQACKSEDYRKLFHLPVEEILVQDFNCAFQKKILLQGHMYLFEQYICFYSNIFGYEKKKVLPLKDVAFVRKSWTAGLFPNAIEIGAWGKKYFFASFLSRDEAYRLIVRGWSRHSGHARTSELLEQMIPSQASLSPTICKNSEILEIQEVGCTEEGDEKQVLPKLEESTVSSAVTTEPGVNESVIWKIEDTPPPPLPLEFKTIMESEFPVDVQDFFELFFSDNATNFADVFRKRCGDEDFRSTLWSSHPRFGHVRDISFRHPVNLYFGPKSAVCSETQRFRVYRDSHLVIETSQQMSEIPYADYFHVEVRWDVERVPKPVSFHSYVRVSMNVDFSKKTLWRGKIEQATLDECKETYSLWVQEAHNVLNSRADPGRVEASLENSPTEGSKPSEDLSLIADSRESEHVRTRKKIAALLGGIRNFVLRFLSENPVACGILLIAIVIVLAQAFTLLTVSSEHHHQSPETIYTPESMKRCYGGSSDALAWLEQRARTVKDEVALAEARLQSLQQDLSLLKLHMNLFERLRTQHQKI